jgi:CDP-glucose 4,6-dehydratase
MLGRKSKDFDQAFNLGPIDANSVSVSELLSMLSTHVPGVKIIEESADFHEAGKLGLNSALAKNTFGWNPNWSTAESIKATAYWYRGFLTGTSPALNLCLDQLEFWGSSGGTS